MSDITTKLAGIKDVLKDAAKGGLKGARKGAKIGGAVGGTVGAAGGALGGGLSGKGGGAKVVAGSTVGGAAIGGGLGAVGGAVDGATIGAGIGSVSRVVQGLRERKAKRAKMEKKATITLAWLEKSAKMPWALKDEKGKRYTQSGEGLVAEIDSDMKKGKAKKEEAKAKKVSGQSNLRNRLTSGAKGAALGGAVGSMFAVRGFNRKGAAIGAGIGGAAGAALGSTKSRTERAQVGAAMHRHDAADDARTANKPKNKRRYYDTK